MRQQVKPQVLYGPLDEQGHILFSAFCCYTESQSRTQHHRYPKGPRPVKHILGDIWGCSWTHSLPESLDPVPPYARGHGRQGINSVLGLQGHPTCSLPHGQPCVPSPYGDGPSFPGGFMRWSGQRAWNPSASLGKVPRSRSP